MSNWSMRRLAGALPYAGVLPHARVVPYAAVVLLAVLASFTGLRNGFTYDDIAIVAENRSVHGLGAWRDLLTQPYWPPPRPGMLYRPLTSLGFAAQWALGEGAPWVFHAGSIMLYAAVCAAVLWLALALLPAPAAFLAGALFAVHPVHVEAVANIVGQSELWAGLASVAAVALYVRRRAQGPLGRGTVAALVGLYAAACLAKEQGFLLPAVLLMAELLVVRDDRTLRARAAELRPLVLLLALVGAAYLAARAAVLGGVAVDIPHAALAQLTASERALTMLAVVPHWIRLLLWPARLSADYSPPGIPLVRQLDAAVLPGLLLILLAIAAFVMARRRPVLRFGLVWVALLLLPVSNILFPTGVMLAERTLFLPSVGAMLVVGAAVTWLLEQRHRVAPRYRWAGIGAALVLIGAAAWQSAERQRVWHDNHTLFAQTVVDAPGNYGAQLLHGATLFRIGDPREGERRLQRAMAMFPYDSDAPTILAQEYERAGFCVPAARYYRRALELIPQRADARLGLVRCLMKQGEYAEARSVAREGLVHRVWRGTFRRLVAMSDEQMTEALTRSNPVQTP